MPVTQEHWFTIRKTDDGWWNFNSLYPAPEQLSNFYLTAYLDSLKQQGYTIFVVRGTLPPPASAAAAAGGLEGQGRWWDPEEVRPVPAAALLQPCKGLCPLRARLVTSLAGDTRPDVAACLAVCPGLAVIAGQLWD